MADGVTSRGSVSPPVLPSHKFRRTAAKILLSCVIFLLELAACLVLFVVVRMFIVRKTIVEKLGDVTIQGRGTQRTSRIVLLAWPYLKN